MYNLVLVSNPMSLDLQITARLPATPVAGKQLNDFYNNNNKTATAGPSYTKGRAYSIVIIVGGRGLLPGFRNCSGSYPTCRVGVLVARVVRSSFWADCAKARPLRRGRGSQCREVSNWEIHNTRHGHRYVWYKTVLFKFRFFSVTVWIIKKREVIRLLSMTELDARNHLFKLAIPLEFSPILSSDCLPGFDSCFSFTFSPIEWYLVLDTGH